tara:strand:+ start:620 stop:1171 length:552 start_codon:yes stop_codon:yes gene_type:complete
VIKGGNYDAALKKYAELLTNAAKRTLGNRTIGKNKTYGKASGKLQKSLTFQIDGDTVMFGSPEPSAQFIYWGVNGTQKGRGSPFSYGSKQPPISAIRGWMKTKPIRLRDAKGGFVKQDEAGLNSAAFLIGRAIKMKGIASLKYFDIAYKETIGKASNKLGEAFAKDLFSHFERKIGTIKLTSK